jgi:hypothetical protein
MRILDTVARIEPAFKRNHQKSRRKSIDMKKNTIDTSHRTRNSWFRQILLATALVTPFLFTQTSNAGFAELGRAGNFVALSTNVGTNGANIDIGSGATTITGNVGLGPYSYGKAIKATIHGNLYVAPTSTTDIHSDLNVTGQRFDNYDLTGAVADAFAASNFFSSLAPTQTFGTIGDAGATFSGTDGRNVISLTSVNTHGNITITGSASSQFVFNITEGFILNGGSITLQGGVTADNVLFNLNGAGAGVIISKPVGDANGIFLAPQREILLDKATLVGAMIGGGDGNKFQIHSGATLTVIPEVSSFLPIVGVIVAVGASVHLRRRKMARMSE